MDFEEITELLKENLILEKDLINTVQDMKEMKKVLI